MQSIGSRLGYDERSHIFQFVDNLTLPGLVTHTLRFGADLRHLGRAHRGRRRHALHQLRQLLLQPQRLRHRQRVRRLPDRRALPGRRATASARITTAPPTPTRFTPRIAGRRPRSSTSPSASAMSTTRRLRPPTGLPGNFDPSTRAHGPAHLPGRATPSSLDVQELANVNACPTAGVNNPVRHRGCRA